MHARNLTHQPTIRDVAKLAKVGLMTVSRVINDHPGVRPATRKKVNAAIETLGYQRNEAARQLKGGRSMTIGLIVPDLSDSFFSSCAHTAQQIARAHGYMTLIVASERDGNLEMQEAELMASRKISGMLVVTSLTDEDDRLLRLQDSGLAIVALERPLQGIRTDSVVVENRAGAESAIQHLITHGHRQIACVGYDGDVYTTRERIEGYANRMRATGLKPAIAMDIRTLDDTRRWLAKALESKSRPTAIFAANHRSSVFLIQALAEAKIAVPKEMALIGFDDFDLAGVLGLTTVTQSPVELVKRSMALLIDRISDQGKGRDFVPAKIVLPVSLTVRTSCGCNAVTG
jgi:LacI family transcriptional regulator